MWWGFSPAINICAEVNTAEANVLCIGQNDCRHVIQTLAKKFQHPKIKLKIYVYEPSIENIARSLLLLSIAIDEKSGIGQRASRFLEIYGNALLRPSTSEYLFESAQRLLKIITDFKYAEEALPFISLDGLKYKERDKLEHIFKYWSASRDSFDILTYWDQRNRAILGTRYDSRQGVYDWDLYMRYIPYGADVVTIQEYKQFREKGISFLQDDSDPCVPNITWSTFSVKGTSPIPGYFGDITTGPYPAYGLRSEDQDLLQKINGQFKKSSTDISLANLYRTFYEIKNKTIYTPSSDGSKDGLSIKRDMSQKIRQRKMTFSRSFDGQGFSSCGMSDVEIFFMSLSSLKDCPKKLQFQNYFDYVTIPQNMVSQVSSEMCNMFKNNSVFFVESLKYCLNMNKDALAKAKTETDELIRNVGGEPLSTFDYKKDDFIKYILHK